MRFRRVRKTTKSDYQLCHVCLNSAPTGHISWHFMVFFEILWRKLRFHWNLIRIMGTWHEDVRTFNTASRWLLIRIRNVLDKSSRENQNTCTFNNSFFYSENRAVYEKMWKNIVESGTPQVRILYWACALHVGSLRLQTHTRNMQYLLLFHFNNVCTDALQCYVTRILSVW